MNQKELKRLVLANNRKSKIDIILNNEELPEFLSGFKLSSKELSEEKASLYFRLGSEFSERYNLNFSQPSLKAIDHIVHLMYQEGIPIAKELEGIMGFVIQTILKSVDAVELKFIEVDVQSLPMISFDGKLFNVFNYVLESYSERKGSIMNLYYDVYHSVEKFFNDTSWVDDIY